MLMSHYYCYYYYHFRYRFHIWVKPQHIWLFELGLSQHNDLQFHPFSYKDLLLLPPLPPPLPFPPPPSFSSFLAVLGFELRPVLARQVLYHLSHTFRTFCFSYISDRVLNFCLGPASDHDPSIPPFYIAKTRGAHHTPSLLVVIVLLTFSWAFIVLYDCAFILFYIKTCKNWKYLNF
jgi:hypothetical protein